VPERIARIVKAIQRLLEDMGIKVVEERIIQFIVNEIHAGKTLEEAMSEPYVVNNTSAEWRREVLERPEIVQAVEEEMAKAFGASGGGEGK
jgi:gamma-glutamyltranspeptidase